MSRTMGRLAALALLSIVPGRADAQADITGTWEVTVESPQGAATIDATFKQVGEAVTGTVTSPIGAVEFKGTMVNDALSVSYSMEMQGNKIDIAMTGKLAGETLTGNLAIAGLGEVPWTARRKPAAGAVPASAAVAPPSPAAASAAGDVSGTWDIVVKMGPSGEFPLSAILKQAGDNVTGTLTSQMGDMPVTGTMTGRALKLQFAAPTPQGDLAITMTGDLGADGLAGKASIAGLGETDWTGKRK